MTADLQLFVVAILLLHVYVIWSLCRSQARADRAARARRRRFRASLINRRLP